MNCFRFERLHRSIERNKIGRPLTSSREMIKERSPTTTTSRFITSSQNSLTPTPFSPVRITIFEIGWERRSPCSTTCGDFKILPETCRASNFITSPFVLTAFRIESIRYINIERYFCQGMITKDILITKKSRLHCCIGIFCLKYIMLLLQPSLQVS